jgi:hypothetical protein
MRLRQIGLEQYAQRFAENEFDFSILNELTDQNSEKIGDARGRPIAFDLTPGEAPAAETWARTVVLSML